MTLLRFLWSLGMISCVAEPLVPATVDEDASLPAITLNGSRFHLVETGDPQGTPVLFLAGGPGNDFAYMTRLDTDCSGRWLGDALRLLWWDQRGSGLSRRHDAPGEIGFTAFRKDLEALIERVDQDEQGVVLIGHSWGGTYATDYANRHPGRVRGLVLLEPGELTRDILDTNPSPAVLDVGAEWLNDFAWGQQLLTLNDHEDLDFYVLLAAREAQSYRVTREQPPTVRLGGAVIRGTSVYGFYPEAFDFTADLDLLQIEVLIIAGDTPTSDLGADLQRRHAPLFPNATLEVFSGSGHNDVAWADGCQSAGLIFDYLERVGVR